MQTESPQSEQASEDNDSPLAALRPLWAGPIRLAIEADLSEIAHLVAVGWRQAYHEILPRELLDVYCEIDRREAETRAAWDRGDRLLIATDAEGLVLGTVGERIPSRLAGFDAEIHRLYVRPDITGGGIGRALVAALVHTFLGEGHRSMSVHTFQANAVGRRFYEKLGGQFHSADVWEGFACVWYTWDEAAMTQIVRNRRIKDQGD